MTATTRILVPVDGSGNCERAVKYVIELVKSCQTFEIHLLNVQPAVSGGVSTFVDKDAIQDWHRDEAEKALSSTRKLLDAAGTPYKVHIGIGNPGDVIASFASKLGCGQIVMGTRGLGSAFGLLLGSVATHVISHVDVPVTLIK
jgi:nucleotide-binding universal stress UspA family protein